MRHFCTAGPIQPDIHYNLPPADRINKGEVFSLIDDRKYFILHAPRQTGKTSCLLALVRELNASGRYRALYINVEAAQAFREDVAGAMIPIVSELAARAKWDLKDDFPYSILEQAKKSGGSGLSFMLEQWCAHSTLPICLMIDEIDAMVGDSLISVLRQLRAGYAHRPGGFPQSVILCGVRDLRNYRIHGTREVITGGRAFNIKAESLRLGDFTPANIRSLYEQHTSETGQIFEEPVYPLVWDLTRGQPWLVNALAYEACFRIEKDRSKAVTADLMQQAKENLILRRDTHLDQLSDKLTEERLRRIIQPILAGDVRRTESEASDDVQYAVDLGLIRRGPEGLDIANAIYREVIPRELSFEVQTDFGAFFQTAWYVDKQGRLDVTKLLAAFQQFFRENSEIWLDRFSYREAGPQLLLQAFLQRIVNGGGRIDREYALGRGRTDLLLIWNHAGGVQRVVIEIKLVRGGVIKTQKLGLAQTAEYMDRSGTEEGHLVLINRTPKVSWKARIFRRAVRAGKHRITVWGM